MLIFEDEFRFLPQEIRRGSTSKVAIVLWQHHLSIQELSDLAHLYTPCLDFTKFTHMGCPKRQIERLSVELLANRLLGYDASILKQENGHPYLNFFTKQEEKTKDTSNLQISISHSAHTYALSWSNHQHGMDIEQWGNRALRIKDKFVNDEEIGLLHQLRKKYQSEDRIATIIWSAKEAVYKCRNEVGADFKHNILLEIGEDGLFKANLPTLKQTLKGEIVVYPQCVLTYCSV